MSDPAADDWPEWVCPRCDGSGKREGERCGLCKGSGRWWGLDAVMRRAAHVREPFRLNDEEVEG